MPSFDVVSKANKAEIHNAVENTKKHISQRYDLKDTKCSLEEKDEQLILMAENEMQLSAVYTIFKEQLAKRGVSLKLLEVKDPVKAGGDMLRQEMHIKQGLSTEECKRLNKLIKDQKFKVNAQIQENQLRVQGKKRDDLQAVIQFLKANVEDLFLEFENFRD